MTDAQKEILKQIEIKNELIVSDIPESERQVLMVEVCALYELLEVATQKIKLSA